MAKDIVIAGYYGFENAGDELTLLALINGLRDIGEDMDITVLSASPEKSKSRYKVKSVNRWNPISLLKVIRSTDLLVFGGGGLLQDITSTPSICYYFALVIMAKMFGKKVILLAQGIGPITKKFNRAIAKFILSRVDAITSRDKESARMLKEYGMHDLKVDVTADMVYSLSSEIEKEKSDDKRSSFVVGVVLRESKSYAGQEKAVEEICRKLQTEYGADIVIIPFHRYNDLKVSKRMAEFLGGCEIILWENLEDIFDVYKRIDIVIGMRLHSLIMACLFKKPFVVVPPENKTSDYDPKINNFMKSLKLKSGNNILSCKDMDSVNSAKRVYDIFMNRDNFNQNIASGLNRLVEISKLNILYLRNYI